MKKILVSILLSVAPTLTLLAEGASGSGGREGWTSPIWHVPMIAWQAVNILIVIGILVHFLKRPAPAFFASRAAEIKELLEKAVREKEDATARLKEVEKRMARLGDEVKTIEKASEEAAAADRKRMMAEAEAEKERIGKEAAEEVKRRVTEARRKLKVYAADLALEMARALLEKTLKPGDQKRLRSDFLRKMEEESSERSV